MGIGHQAGQRLESAGLGGTGFHQHHGGGGVVDARGIACGHGAVFFDEHRFELGHVRQAAVRAEVLVGGVGHIAFLALERDGHDLAFEVTGLGGALGTVMALYRQCVLLFAGDAPFGSDVFCRHAHVNGVERVVQRADHHVHHLGVTHAGAPAHIERGVGRAAHAFGAATNGHIGVAQQNALAGADDGLQARAAQAVHVECRGAFSASAMDGRHARQIHVLGLGIDHVAKHHMAYVFALGLGARQGLSHHLRGQIGGGNVFQAAAEGANGGTDGANDDYFTGHGVFPLSV